MKHLSEVSDLFHLLKMFHLLVNLFHLLRFHLLVSRTYLLGSVMASLVVRGVGTLHNITLLPRRHHISPGNRRDRKAAVVSLSKKRHNSSGHGKCRNDLHLLIVRKMGRLARPKGTGTRSSSHCLEGVSKRSGGNNRITTLLAVQRKYWGAVITP